MTNLEARDGTRVEQVVVQFYNGSMSRTARVVVPGYPHHVTQRGNRRADVFEDDADREAYLRFLYKYARHHGLDVWAYCLMTNHVHLVAVPRQGHSLALALRDAHAVYAMHFNSKTRLTGHVWQGRFYSCLLDEAHLWHAMRYVERNPVRAGLVERCEHFKWSSAAAHCGTADDALLATLPQRPAESADWSEWLHSAEDDAVCERLRKKTNSGRPCGSLEFIERMGAKLGRSCIPKKAGRPPERKTP